MIGSEYVGRTIDEIENPSDARSIIWITQLRFREQWVSQYGATIFRNAFDSLQKEPRYQRALVRYGIDDDSIARIRVHTAELLRD